MTQIAIVGGGKIGEALLAGLISGGEDSRDIRVSNRRAERGKELAEQYGVVDCADNTTAVEGADVVFLCVKPADTVRVLEEISDQLDINNEDTVVISLAAGVTVKQLEDVVAAGTPVARVMPNTPMLVGHGMSALARGRFITDEQIEDVSHLLGAVGEVAVVDESKIDAVTALSGSSPAYIFLIAEAMIDAGVNLGLTRELSERLTVSAMEGAAAMMKESGRTPGDLRADVCSPGGTTIAAVRVLEEYKIRSAFFRATEVCAEKSRSLGATAPKKRPLND